MKPDRLTPLIARHVDAITTAKLEGVTWRQLAGLFGVDDDAIRAAFNRARKGLACGRYVVQQLPLPELPQPLPAPKAAPVPAAPSMSPPPAAPVAGQKYSNFKRLNID
ncbi:MAG: hypothetical protein ACYCVY_11215 [Acidiferrobacteraceae bacterium]